MACRAVVLKSVMNFISVSYTHLSGDKKEGDDSKDVADNSSENSNGDGGKTRKKSDKNLSLIHI